MTIARLDRPTPALVVDSRVLDDNIARMAERARSIGVALRPHVKTHKCLEIGRRQLAAGADGITVATVGEAEIFAAGGFDDIFIAYPLWVDEALGRRIAALAMTTTLRIGCDSAESAANTAATIAGAAVGIVIEVDSGMRRSGVTPEAAGDLAVAIRDAGLRVDGVFTFTGHSYAVTGPADAAAVRRQAAIDEHDALARAAEALRDKGFQPSIVSGGATPSMDFVQGSGVTEERPGAYIFNDAQQWELGACTPEQVALKAYATVVSHAGGRAVLNSGSKVLGADKARYASGSGRLLDHPDARIVQLSEHHAVCDFRGAPLPPLGSVLRVVPNHCCNAVNYADELVVVDGEQQTDVWRVVARGANS